MLREDRRIEAWDPAGNSDIRRNQQIQQLGMPLTRKTSLKCSPYALACGFVWACPVKARVVDNVGGDTTEHLCFVTGCRARMEPSTSSTVRSGGIKVLLSLGGDRGLQSLNSTEDAHQVAEYIYRNFLGGTPSPPSRRPFGKAVLDGVNFSVAGKTPMDRMHWEDLAKALAGYSTARRKVYLVAAPQCTYPDPTLRKALNTGLFDIVWIRFYNNTSCQYSEVRPWALMGSWLQWNSNLHVGGIFLGLPASRELVGNGYVPPVNFMAEILPYISNFPRFWGVMLWDRYQDKRSKYSYWIRSAVMEPQAAKSSI
ncbi:hypothetical protein Taro_048061 [Colocasia esculenta]|uniref:GH18 domain-containing protein n=1 Tax=Colocasia esculenta TaxID=4460 RepID=A0A843WXH8_COLES|nr:hypothetical protein [Colocasia esculenta]